MDDYSIKSQVDHFINEIQNDAIVVNFCVRMQDKGRRARMQDEEFFNRMMQYIHQLANLAILTNANKTAKLKEAADFLDSEEGQTLLIEQVAEQMDAELVSRIAARRANKAKIKPVAERSNQNSIITPEENKTP